MTKNVTLRLEQALLTRARHLAVDRHVSLSAWLAALIEDTVKREDQYESTRARALHRLGKGLPLGGKPLKRDEIYDR